MEHQQLCAQLTRQSGAWGLGAPVRASLWRSGALAVLAQALTLAGMLCLWQAGWAVWQEQVAWGWLGWAGLCLPLGMLARLQAFDVSHFAAFRLETCLRSALCEQLARLPLGYVQQRGAAPLSAVVFEDVKNLHIYIADNVPQLARAMSAPVLALAVLLWLDWRLAVFAVLVLVVVLAVLAWAMRDSSSLQREYESARAQVGRTVVEFVQAMPVVRVFDACVGSFGRFQRALDAFGAVYRHWLAHCGTSARLGVVLTSPLPTLWLAVLLGAYGLQHGALAPKDWLALLLLGCTLVESIMPLMWISHLLRRAQQSALAIQEVLAQQGLAQLPAVGERQGCDVRFDSVHFCYPGREKAALAGVSFELRAGSVTALVGASGAGKSTVARLLPRFWDVDQGRITLGGVDIRALSHDELLAQVAFVFQDVQLFNDTLAANLLLARPDASRDALLQACHDACLGDLLDDLPQGLDTPLGEGGWRLSGGQRQRMAIARALLQDCPILVLDEATAHADPENELLLLRALARLMAGRTVLVIAHRLATIAHVDQILVFEQGQICERGRHDELLAENGRYARWWQQSVTAQQWQLGEAARLPEEVQ